MKFKWYDHIFKTFLSLILMNKNEKFQSSMLPFPLTLLFSFISVARLEGAERK